MKKPKMKDIKLKKDANKLLIQEINVGLKIKQTTSI